MHVNCKDMEKKDSTGTQILWIAIFLLAAFVAFRFLRVFGRYFLVLIGLFLLGFGVYRLLLFLQARRKKKRYLASPEGVIELRVDQCLNEIAKNKKAMEGIRQNIAELEEKLGLASYASEESKQPTRKLILDFQSELELREAKIFFLEACIQKLQAVLQNYELSKAFASKKAELQTLREQNFEEIADLEELRSDIEYDRTYLETIDNLSTRMLGTQSLETVEALRRELEEMTRSLDDKP